jgi:hypothetical protein
MNLKDLEVRACGYIPGAVLIFLEGTEENH